KTHHAHHGILERCPKEWNCWLGDSLATTEFCGLSPPDTSEDGPGRKTVVSLTRATYWGKRNLVRKRLWLLAPTGVESSVSSLRRRPREIRKLLRFAEHRERHPGLRIDFHKVPAGFSDAKERAIDFEPDHGPDVVGVLAERFLVDLHAVGLQ